MFRFHTAWFALVLGLVSIGCRQNTPSDSDPKTEASATLSDSVDRHPNAMVIADGELPGLMVPGSRLMPMISAHRGGRDVPGFPENSLEVFAYTLERTPAMLECDVNVTSDDKLILMHDNSLDRTTTGIGRVQETPWSAMEDLFLVDDQGNTTKYRIPTFGEALDFAQGKALLSVDVKRGVDFARVVQLIEEKDMVDYVVVITYSTDDAETVHRLNEDLMISVSIRNQEEWQRMKNTAIPYDRMVAFTGTRLSPKALFDTLHTYDIPAILGTLGNLDQRVAARGDSLYLEYLELGADILATDRPVQAGVVVKGRKGERGNWRKGERVKGGKGDTSWETPFFGDADLSGLPSFLIHKGRTLILAQLPVGRLLIKKIDPQTPYLP